MKRNFKNKSKNNFHDDFKKSNNFNKTSNSSKNNKNFNKSSEYKSKENSYDDFKKSNNFIKAKNSTKYNNNLDTNIEDKFYKKNRYERKYLNKENNRFNSNNLSFTSKNSSRNKNNLDNQLFFKDKLTKRKDIEDFIWGKHSVLEAIKEERPINRIWCTAEIFSSDKFYLSLKDLKKKGVLIEEVSWTRLAQLTYGAVHQGIVLQVSHAKTITLHDLISLSKRTKKNLIIALDGITDPHNVGAIIRSAEAFGCIGVIIPQRRSAGITGTVAKVSAGALEHINICRVVNLNRALEDLKNSGSIVIGLSLDGQIEISTYMNDDPFIVLVIGSEDKGLSLLTQKNCDYLMKIPLKGKTCSLNASVAAAITLYQLSK